VHAVASVPEHKSSTLIAGAQPWNARPLHQRWHLDTAAIHKHDLLTCTDAIEHASLHLAQRPYFSRAPSPALPAALKRPVPDDRARSRPMGTSASVLGRAQDSRRLVPQTLWRCLLRTQRGCNICTRL
jgi:hypothetical protein